MISAERFIVLCFLTQVSIGLSYAQNKDQGGATTKPADFEINSEENKIEDGPFFFKINAKPNQPYKPFTLPILEIPNFDGFDQKPAWKVYNNEKTSKVEENDKVVEQEGKQDKFLKADDVIANESTTVNLDDDITTPESASGKLEKILVEPIHRSTYIYFYKPFDSPRTPATSSTTEKEDTKDYSGTGPNAFSSLGFGYPFLDNIFSIPNSNIRTQAKPKLHHTQHEQEDDSSYDSGFSSHNDGFSSHHNGFSSLGFGYPFINNFNSFLDEVPIKRAVTKVRIFSTNFEDDQPAEQGGAEQTDESNEDKKKEENIKVDEIKEDNVQQNTREDSNSEDKITLKKDEAHQDGSANVEEILSSILPIYDWATSSLLSMNMNQDILNIGRILRNSYYGSLAKVADKKEEHPESQLPTPDILPDVERYDTSEPHSFIEEVMDELNNGDFESNRELNIERPPTDKDLPDIGSEDPKTIESQSPAKRLEMPPSDKDLLDFGSEDPKTIKPRSPAKCICGFSQGSTNSCTCFPETLVYYQQYCSVPLPPTD